MNFTGKLEGLKMDYATKKQSISVEVKVYQAALKRRIK
jgi:hypothetical protein